MLDLVKNFSSAGEAAYAAAAGVTGCDQPWSEANQEKWEEAAAAAIMFGQQHAAEAQVAFFKTGACVPYCLNDEGDLFTAQLAEKPGAIDICVNGNFVRRLECGDVSGAIREFSGIAKAPPGFIIA